MSGKGIKKLTRYTNGEVYYENTYKNIAGSIRKNYRILQKE